MKPLDRKIIGQSSAAVQLKKMIALIAPSDAPAIIYGPTGSGKELVAEALHEESRRKGRILFLLTDGIGVLNVKRMQSNYGMILQAEPG